MFDSSWLWVVFTVIAAAAQTVRNATQRELTTKLGTVGATHVRFLFGFPFAFVFLAAVMIALGQDLPRPPLVFWRSGRRWRRGAGAPPCADAGRHERSLLRGGLCLYQDRAGAGRAVRPRLSR